MRKISILVISVFLFLGCKQKSIVPPTFYYWKTDYQNEKEETAYLDQFKSNALYVRILRRKRIDGLTALRATKSRRHLDCTETK